MTTGLSTNVRVIPRKTVLDFVEAIGLDPHEVISMEIDYDSINVRFRVGGEINHWVRYPITPLGAILDTPTTTKETN